MRNSSTKACVQVDGSFSFFFFFFFFFVFFFFFLFVKFCVRKVLFLMVLAVYTS
jgi:hypothetical protein